MISLDDSEMQILLSAAAPLQPHQRDQFLRDCASELSKFEVVGPGIISRTVSKLQKQHLVPRSMSNRDRVKHPRI